MVSMFNFMQSPFFQKSQITYLYSLKGEVQLLGPGGRGGGGGGGGGGPVPPLDETL